jgi:hypothetical protein
MKMDIDFIEAYGFFTGKDTPYFGHLQEWSENKVRGSYTYILEGQKKVKIHYSPATGELVMEGSMMYFWQGHNFIYSKSSFVDAIDYIGKLLHVNLWGMYLNILECGVIFEVDKSPTDYIQHHREGKGMMLYEDPKDKGRIRKFNDKLAHRKMYDAGYNLKYKASKAIRETIKAADWNPKSNYLKWEVHYIKPELSVNAGYGIRLSDLMNPQWEAVFSVDVYDQYQRIIPMKAILPPVNKSSLHAADILAIELAETKLNEGKTLNEVKKMLYARINASSLLTKTDKDARKRQIRVTLDKLAVAKESPWDISRQLEKALNLEEQVLTSTPFNVVEKHNNSYAADDEGEDLNGNVNQQNCDEQN